MSYGVHYLKAFFVIQREVELPYSQESRMHRMRDVKDDGTLPGKERSEPTTEGGWAALRVANPANLRFFGKVMNCET